MNQVDLCEAIASKIAALWPDRMIYRDFCPADFQRPSSFLYVTEAGFTSAGIAVVLWNVETELELFCSTDDYDAQSTEELRQNQAAVLEAFGAPHLIVGDRAVQISTVADGSGPGVAYIRFTASWYDQRPGYHDIHDPDDPVTKATPLMEDYALRVNSEEGESYGA